MVDRARCASPSPESRTQRPEGQQSGGLSINSSLARIDTLHQCNIPVLGTLESTLEPSESCTSDIWVPDSGLGPLGPPGPLHFSSRNLGSIMHIVHEAYSTYMYYRSWFKYFFFFPDKCNRGCASIPTCWQTLSACTSEVAHNAASIVLLHQSKMYPMLSLGVRVVQGPRSGGFWYWFQHSQNWYVTAGMGFSWVQVQVNLRIPVGIPRMISNCL